MSSPEDFCAQIQKAHSKASEKDEWKLSWRLAHVENDRETSQLIKDIKEEARPLCHLGRLLEIEEHKVEIALLPRNSDDDAIIKLDGSEHKIQITCTHDYQERLRDEAMSAYGWVPANGPIERDEMGGFTFEFGECSVDKQLENFADKLLQRIGGKSERACDDGTWLLVSIRSLSPLWDEGDASSLRDIMTFKLQATQTPYAKIIILDTCNPSPWPNGRLELNT